MVSAIAPALAPAAAALVRTSTLSQAMMHAGVQAEAEAPGAASNHIAEQLHEMRGDHTLLLQTVLHMRRELQDQRQQTALWQEAVLMLQRSAVQPSPFGTPSSSRPGSPGGSPGAASVASR